MKPKTKQKNQKDLFNFNNKTSHVFNMKIFTCWNLTIKSNIVQFLTYDNLQNDTKLHTEAQKIKSICYYGVTCKLYTNKKPLTKPHV